MLFRSKVVSSKSVKAISFYGANYCFINDMDIDSIDFLTWEHRKKKEFLPLSFRCRKMLDDERVKLILIKDKYKES